MREVSCKALDVVFRYLRKRSIPVDPLLQGFSYPPQHFFDRNSRIDWSDFIVILKRVRAVLGGVGEFETIGSQVFDSPFVRPLSLVLRMLTNPRTMLRWVYGSGYGGHLLFSNMKSSFEDLGSSVRVSLQVEDGFEAPEEFFYMCKGATSMFPRLSGGAKAEVEMTIVGGRAEYVVKLAAAKRFSEFIRRFWNVIYATPRAIKEIENAQQTLEARYVALERSKIKIDAQARQLRTVHEIGRLVDQGLDFERTIEAAAQALVTQAGFDGVEILVTAQSDETVKRLESTAGDATLASQGRQVALASHGREIGFVRLARKGGKVDSPEDDSLLEILIPTLAMALDNALAYSELAAYRVDLEKRVEQRTAELTKTRDELARSVGNLERVLQEKTRFFSNINHELRTPLSLMSLALDRLLAEKAGPLSEEQRHQLQSIERNASRLLGMVSDLLILAAGEEGKLRVQREPLELVALAKEVVSLMVDAAAERQIELKLLAPEPVRISGDAKAVDRVLSNLLSNALKFTAAGGTVKVRVFREGKEAVLEVTDTGIGISPEDQARIFERFEQAGPSQTPRFGGTGIGLSLVQEVVAAHDGTVGVRSARGSGSTFVIRFPAEEGAAVTSSMSSAAEAALPLPTPAASQPEQLIYPGPALISATVVVAEDDPGLRKMISETLSKDYRVLAARDGEEALEVAARYGADLVVTDISMPRMDGLELCRAFLASRNNRLAPVIVLTARHDMNDKMESFKAGAVDYVEKPFNSSELLARVNAQLQIRALALKVLESERLASVGSLMSGMAHELRNPLNGLVNAVYPLRKLIPAADLPRGGPADELLTLIEDCGERIAKLSQDLLSFAKANAISMEEEPLPEMIDKAVMIIKSRAQGVELRARHGYEGKLRCSPSMLGQVFLNLLGNAVQAAGEGGWVAVESSEKDGQVVVDVSDSGPGVPEDIREKIFDPFFSTKPAGQGTGLGLSISREIMGRHGGTLGIVPSTQGAVFRVTLSTQGNDLAPAGPSRENAS